MQLDCYKKRTSSPGIKVPQAPLEKEVQTPIETQGVFGGVFA